MVDRKTLSFNAEQIKYESVNIMPISIKLDNSIYQGTIIDGIHIKHDKKREKFFVITDLYLFRGVSTEKDKINMKLSNIETYLNYNMKSCTGLTLTINKLYELDSIDKLVNEDIKKTHDFHVRGISFYPVTSGTKLIYVFNEDKDKKIMNKNNDIMNMDTIHKTDKNTIHKMDKIIEPEIKKTKIKYVAKSDYMKDDLCFVIELRKTEISDVYKLFVVEQVEKEDKTILKTKKMGIAYIPTKDNSMMCKNVFSKNVGSRALFKCKFDIIKNKWIPIEEAKNVKVPDMISKIEEKLEMVEETDSESD